MKKAKARKRRKLSRYEVSYWTPGPGVQRVNTCIVEARNKKQAKVEAEKIMKPWPYTVEIELLGRSLRQRILG